MRRRRRTTGWACACALTVVTTLVVLLAPATAGAAIDLDGGWDGVKQRDACDVGPNGSVEALNQLNGDDLLCDGTGQAISGRRRT